MIGMDSCKGPDALLVARQDTFYNLIRSWTRLGIQVFLLGFCFFLGSTSGYAASLLTGDAPASASADLTVNGPADWIHWGLTSASSIDRKAAVTPQSGATWIRVRR